MFINFNINLEFSDVIAFAALGISLITALITFLIYRSQHKLNKLLLNQGESEAQDAKKASLSVKIIKLGSDNYRLRIGNSGKATARNVDIHVEDGGDLLHGSDVANRFPHEELKQHENIELIASPSYESSQKLVVRMTWADEHSEDNSEIFYPTL